MRPREPRGSTEMADQVWQFRAFPAPNGEQAAVIFLNEPLRQGRGEASPTLRNAGTAALLWLEPGSLRDGTGQTWPSPHFPAPTLPAPVFPLLTHPSRPHPPPPPAPP